MLKIKFLFAKQNFINNVNSIDKSLYCRLIVGSEFDFNFWNQFDTSISTIEIDSKSNSIRANLKSTRFDSSRFSILILEIESNC